MTTPPTISPRFFGQRLRVVRFLRGLSQSALAEKAGLAPSMISRLEQDARVPSAEVLAQLCETLSVPAGFFSSRLHFEAAYQEVHFRHRARTPARQRNVALAHSTLLLELVEFFEANLKLPPVTLPKRPTRLTPGVIEAAAADTRRLLGLPNDRPLASLVGTIESAGIPVVLSDHEADCVDAFSVHRLPRPVVILNRKDSGSRVNFTGAHELGHLVLHEGLETGDRETESEANRFASAFLMPARAFAQEFPQLARGRIAWRKLVVMKQRWRVSIQAMIRRARDLDLISPTVYRRAYQYASAKGWRRSDPGEPGEFEAEQPEFLRECFAVARRKGITPVSIAARLQWSMDDLRFAVCASPLDSDFQTTGDSSSESNIIFAFRR